MPQKVLYELVLIVDHKLENYTISQIEQESEKEERECLFVCVRVCVCEREEREERERREREGIEEREKG